MVKYCTCTNGKIAGFPCEIHGYMNSYNNNLSQKVTKSVSLEDFGNLHALKAQNAALLDELQAIRDTLGLQDGQSVALQAKALRNGNTALLGALMEMVNQHFYHSTGTGDDTVSHSHMSADEGAIEILVEAGYAEQVKGNRYRLLWDKLAERQEREK